MNMTFTLDSQCGTNTLAPVEKFVSEYMFEV